MSERFQQNLVLSVSTVAFTICFACWVLNGVLITYLVGTNVFAFSAAEVGWLLAVPFLTGSISRVPLGILADRYGGRSVFFLLMLAVCVPLFLVSFADSLGAFLAASAGFGLAGGGFAVGVAYVAEWFTKERQGTALGIFGMGNVGAGLTTLVAPSLLVWLAGGGADPDHWRQLPRIYAAVLLLVAVLFLVLTQNRAVKAKPPRTLNEVMAPLGSLRVWRFGLYYFLVFGAFVAIAQWLVPYSVNVYGLTLVEAGLLATAFSFPSGAIRAAGGWLSDRYGARPVMFWVFTFCAASCAVLAVPRMDIDTPGAGMVAAAPGTVGAVTPSSITIGGRVYPLVPRTEPTPSQADTGTMVLPHFTSWQEPAVAPGAVVVKGELIARGVTNVYYPANVWIFAFFVLVFGVATGIGKAGVYKFIPDFFPENVGVVGGIVGMIGALGGFVLPPVFGYMLGTTGFWTTCWFLLAVISIWCLVWMQSVVRSILKVEAPNLLRLIEFRPPTALLEHAGEIKDETTVEGLLRRVPMFSDLTPEELGSLARIGRYETAAAGSVLLHEGDAGDSSFVLLRGAVKVYRTTPDAGDVMLATLKPGAVFGELALIDGEPRSASAVAMEPSDLFVLGRDDFIKLLSGSPRILGDIMVGLSRRLRQTNAEHLSATLEKERLRSESELARHRMITQMVAGVAHEVNTPVGVANHAASIITEHLTPAGIAAMAKNDEARSNLDDLVQAARLIENNLARADVLIRSFKNLSVQQVTEERTNVDVPTLTKEIVGLFAPKARASKLEIQVIDGLGAAGVWEGYPGAYSQVLLNLVENASRYAYPAGVGGKVEVRLDAAASGEGFRVTIRDFGRGIPAENLKKVWDPFFTTGRGQGGSGLGMAIVNNLVTSTLNGRVGIESEVSRGTAVWFEFPKVAPKQPPEQGGRGAVEAAEKRADGAHE